MTYDLAITLVTPTMVQVEGFFYDANGPLASRKVYCRPYGRGFWNASLFHIYAWDQIGTTDSNGYLVGYVYKQPVGEHWEMKIEGDSSRYRFALGDGVEQDLSQLVDWG